MEIIRKMGTTESRILELEQRVSCYYSIFFMLFLNDKLTPHDKALFLDGQVEESHMQQKNLLKRLKNLNRLPGLLLS